MTRQEIQDKFTEEYTKYITRQGSQEFLSWLQSTDFFNAPASTKFHGAYEGGLAYHSLRVFYETIRLLKSYSDIVTVSGETAAICSLLHDVCKIGCYKTEMRNVKENGQWVQKPFYTFNEDFKFGGHGSKSVFLIQKYMSLSDEEATAINCHMGSWGNTDERSVGDAYEQFPFAWILHVADEACGFVLGA